MKPLLDFDDAGAQDDHPAKGVTVGDIRAWHDERERLRSALQLMVWTFKPFALKPVGEPGSPARADQDDQIEVHARASAALK